MTDPILASELTQPQRADKITTYHAVLFAICFLSTLFGGTVSVLMSVYLPEAVRDLLGNFSPEELNYMTAYVNAVFIFGWAIGGISWGILSDQVGRSWALVYSIGSFGLFTLLTFYTDSWMLVMAFRFFSGFGVGGILVVTPTLLTEVWPARTRSIFIGILSIGFPVGIFSAGLMDLLVTRWQQAFTIGYIPLCLAIVSIWVLRESGKWERTKTTNESVKQKLIILFAGAYRKDLLIGSVTFGTMLIGLWAIFSWLPTWVQTLLASSDGQQERGLAMMMMGAGGLTGGFLSGWLSNGLGLRKAMMVCFAGCFIMSVLLFKFNTSFSFIIYGEIICLALFFGASQGILSAYIPELFPSAIRATATGFCFNFGRFVTASIVFVVGALVISLGGYGNAIFTFSLVFLIGLATTFFSKEVGV